MIYSAPNAIFHHFVMSFDYAKNELNQLKCTLQMTILKLTLSKYVIIVHMTVPQMRRGENIYEMEKPR